MKVTARITADVDPSVKEKLKEVAAVKGETMAQFLTNVIEKEHKKIFKK
jgi:uncharacterized protein (DUF1778 family)